MTTQQDLTKMLRVKRMTDGLKGRMVGIFQGVACGRPGPVMAVITEGGGVIEEWVGFWKIEPLLPITALILEGRGGD